MKPGHVSPLAALAATIGEDLAEMREYRYQSTRTPHAVYVIADTYYCTRKKPPTYSEDGIQWAPHKDQFWALKAGTVVWVGTERKE